MIFELECENVFSTDFSNPDLLHLRPWKLPWYYPRYWQSQIGRRKKVISKSSWIFQIKYWIEIKRKQLTYKFKIDLFLSLHFLIIYKPIWWIIYISKQWNPKMVSYNLWEVPRFRFRKGFIYCCGLGSYPFTLSRVIQWEKAGTIFICNQYRSENKIF